MRRPIVASEDVKEVATTPEPVCTSEAESANETAVTKLTSFPFDADLSAVVNAWPTLPAVVRAGIAAMVRAAAAMD
jgi:hypothetical protein